MATIPNVCPICGSPYSLDEKGRYVCRFCGHIKPDEATPEETALLYEAAAKLRLADFDGARERYEDIAARFPKCAEAHWGLTLCQYGIKYEDDYDGKKVATCYAASYLSLYGNPDFQKALELADPESRAYYEAQAKVIEDRRKEWVEKARREKPYDIFISYKDSEDGDRTQDSYKAYDLYNELTARGYRVFFSRVSLKDKTGENYEPYIFAALNSATVMLVYASKPEYVKSTWVKNEWNRYLARIKEKEKAPDSLCVVVDGFQPGALPPVLKNKQHLLYGSLTFLQDLLAYVEKQVSAATYKTHRIERKEVALAKKKAKKGIEAVKSEEISSVKKKTKSLSKEGIQKRAIGASNVPLLTPNQESKLALAEAYLSQGEYEKAKGLYESVLEENPRHPSANFGLLLCSSHVSSLKEWGKSASLQTKREALPMALSVIDAGNGDEAKELLGIYAQACIDACEAADFETGQAIYEGIASYDFGTVRSSFHEDVLTTLEDSREIGFAGIVMPYLSVQPESFQKHLLTLSSIALDKGDYPNAKGFLTLVEDYFGYDRSSFLLSLCAKHEQPNPTALLDAFASRGDFSSLSGSLPLTMPQIEALFADVAEHALIRLSEGEDITPYVDFLLPYRLPFREGFIQKAIQACMENPCEATSTSLKALLPSFDEAHRDSFIAVIRSYALHCKENEAYDLAKEWFDMAIDYAPEDRGLYRLRFLARLGVEEAKLPEAIASTKDYTDIEALLSLRGKDSFYSLLEPYLNACLSAPDLVAALPVFNNLLAYLPEAEEDQLHRLLLQMGDALLEKGLFSQARHVYESCVALSPKDHHAYWGMLLCFLQCKDEAELLASQTPISGLPEYENAILAASEDKKALAHYVNVELRQKENIEKEIKRREKEEAKRKAKARRRNRRIIFSSSTIIAVALATVVAFTVVVPYVNEVREQRRQERIETATAAIDQGDYAAAIQALSASPDAETQPMISMANAGLQFQQQNIEEGIGYVVEAGGEANVHYDSGDYPAPKTNETIKKKWIDNSASGYDYVWTIDRFTVSVAQRPFTAEVYLKLTQANLITYTIDYDLQEGTATQPNPTSYTVVSSFTLNQPVRKGYSFEGWYDGAGNRVERIEKGRTGNLSLTAKWKAITYTITYDLDGGTLSQDNPASYTIEDTFEFPYAPTKEGYIFDGWVDQNGNYCAGVNHTTGDLQVKAMWWGDDYPIKLLSDSPTRGSVSGPEEGQVDAEVTVHATPNPGCVFLGWYEGENKVSEEADYTFVMPIDEVILTAKWDVLHYEISYLLDGGEIAEANPTSYTVEDTLPFASPTKNGYEFVRWEDEQGNPYTGIVPGMTGNQTFIAKWKGVLQNLEVSSSDVYGGGTSLISGTGITGETITVKAITYGGYTFAGWYQGEEKKSDELTYSFTMPPEAVSLVARFSPNLYDLSVKADEPTLGSAEIVSGTGYTRESITVKATPNDGVWFAGWYKGPTQMSTEETYTFTMPSSDLQLTAKFIELPAGFVLENEDESMGTARIVGVNKTYPKVVAVEAVAKEGYAFAGWYIGDTFKSYDTTYYITPTVPTTLTATWVPSHGNLVLQVFNPDGGNASVVSGEGKAGDKMVVAAQAKDGYYFAGWADDAHGIISTENTYQFTMPEGVYRLYAGFNAKEKILTISSEDANKGTVAVTSGVGYAGEEVTITATPAPEYRFQDLKLWYYEESSATVLTRLYGSSFDSGSHSYTGGSANPVFTSKDAAKAGLRSEEYEDLELICITETIAQLLNSGSGSVSYVKAPNETTVAKKDQLWIRYKRPTWTPNSGPTGWACYYYGEGNFDDGIDVNQLSDNLNASIDAVAEFLLGYGDWTYQFEGWYNGEEKVSDQATYTFTVPNEELNLVAKWATQEYSITYELDGGSLEGPLSRKYTVEDAFSLPVPAKEGYSFDGWRDTYGNKYEEIVKGTGGNLLLTACWKANSYYIVLDAQEGNVDPKQIDVDFNDDFVLPTANREGYLFLGWYDSAETKIVSGKFVFTEDLNLHAIWGKDDMVASVHVLGSNECDVGGTIMLSIALDNDSQFVPTKIKVAGKYYDCVSSSTATMAYANVIIGSEKGLGNVMYTIEEVTLLNGAISYAFSPTLNNEFNVIVSASFGLVDLYIADEENNEVQACLAGTVHLVIVLDNEQDYPLKKVYFNSEEYYPTRIDNNRYYFPVEFEKSPGHGFYLTGYVYNNGFKDISRSIDSLWAKNNVYVYENAVPIEIHNAEELHNIEMFKYYSLANDIDLSNYDWTPIDMTAYIVGNGYSIKNYNATQRPNSSECYCGLFRKIDGILKDVVFDNINITVIAESTLSTVNVGLVAGSTGYEIWGGCNLEAFNNVVIKDTCSLVVSYDSNSTNLRIGMFIGYAAGHVKFKGCSANFVTVPTTSAYVGYMPTDIASSLTIIP